METLTVVAGLSGLLYILFTVMAAGLVGVCASIALMRLTMYLFDGLLPSTRQHSSAA